MASQRCHKRMTKTEADQVRRLMLIELRAGGLDPNWFAPIFRISPDTVAKEIHKGYPGDLDPEVAEAITEGVAEAIQGHAERMKEKRTALGGTEGDGRAEPKPRPKFRDGIYARNGRDE